MTARKPEQVKKQAHHDTEVGVTDEFVVTHGVKGAIIGALNDAVGGGKNRRLVLGWLFGYTGEMSTKAIKDDNAWWALYQWVGFYQDENMEWRRRPEFPIEAALILTAAVKGQDEVASDSMMEQAAGFLGGVVTDVTGTDGKFHGEDVEAPEDYKLKKRIFDFMDGGGDDVI